LAKRCSAAGRDGDASDRDPIALGYHPACQIHQAHKHGVVLPAGGGVVTLEPDRQQF